jgi:hypothetical protein
MVADMDNCLCNTERPGVISLQNNRKAPAPASPTGVDCLRIVCQGTKPVFRPSIGSLPTPRSPKPRESSRAPAIRRSKENGHERIPSEYIVKIGFWLRAYGGFTVEADNDVEAIKKGKTAMESDAYSEDIDIEERRTSVIAFIDSVTPDDCDAVIEEVEFNDDRVHGTPQKRTASPQSPELGHAPGLY